MVDISLALLLAVSPATPEEVEAAPAEAAPELKLDAPAEAVQAKRIAVYELELQEIPPNIGTVVTDSLLAEVRKLQGVSAIGMDEIRDMLSHEANKQILGCESDDSCLAEIAGALGVDDLVTGKLSRVGDGHVMVIRRIDQRRANVAGAVNKRLKAGSGQEFLLAVGPTIEELFPERALREGAKRGVPKEVALRLDPPPLPRWSFWAVAGGAAAAAVVGGVFGLLALDGENDFNDFANQGGVIDGATLKEKENSAESRATAANVSYATAGTLAISAAIMYLFTDWEGYGDAP